MTALEQPEADEADAAGAASPARVSDHSYREGRLRRDRWEAAFLADYKLWGNLAQAATVAGVNVETVRRHRKLDPAFDAVIADAHEQFVDQLEQDLVRLGRGKNNALALMMRLKAERPHKYEDKLRVDAAVKSTNINVFATPEEARELLRTMLADATDLTRAQLSGDVIDADVVEPAVAQKAISE